MASFPAYRVNNDEQVPAYAATSSSQSPESYLEYLSKNLSIKVIESDDEKIIFDLIGVDASIANSLRRIMLAEVPTIAFETVWMMDNTTVIQDEVLSHRIGMIPIKADASLFEDAPQDPSKQSLDTNTLVFKCHVDFKSQESGAVYRGKDGEPHTVYSRDIKFSPVGRQAEQHPEGSIGMVHDDIIVAKMLKTDRLKFDAYAHKGIGKDHAKYSPVATAAYRLLPDIKFGKPVTGVLATELKNMCPMDVFDVEDLAGTMTATAARPRNCTMCRECIRKEGWQDGSRVQLFRKADHFIFSVETAGAMEPAEIVRQAIKILKQKSNAFRDLVKDRSSSN